MQTTFETIVDRSDEFDQTKKHEPDPAPAEMLMHPGEPARGVEAVFASGRSLSPSILEFRIQELKKELRAEQQRHNKTMEALIAATNRIDGFERLCQTLSEEVDRTAANLRAISIAAALDATDPIDRASAETLIVDVEAQA